MKKLRYNRVMIVSIVLIILIGIGIYLWMNMNHYYDYQGDIQKRTCTYTHNNKIYSFDLNTFQDDGHDYVSLNDMYNMIFILDSKTKVYIDENKHILVYKMSDDTYYFRYGHDQIISDRLTINVNENKTHLYRKDGHIYIDCFYIEDIFFNHKKKITFQNEKAIIQ